MMENNMNRRYVVSGQNYSGNFNGNNNMRSNSNQQSCPNCGNQNSSSNINSHNDNQGCACDNNSSFSDLMHAIMEADFYAQDLKLYLDTHPDDTRAVEMFREAVRQYKATRKVFEENFYPLTSDEAGKNGTWDWIEGNFPPDSCPCSQR